VIRRYHERCPKVRVKVLDASANEVLATVARGEADFGLNFIGSQEGDLDFKSLVEERFVAAVSTRPPAGQTATRELVAVE
jgi:DNA-binding transcriptional LysR family regulator